MKNKGEIRWIQLSDLHMFDSTEVARQKKALFNQFSKTIDFFIITGDLHQYNSDYQLSEAFLTELMHKMEIEKEDIIIVPGNHDVVPLKRRNEVIGNIDKNIEVDSDVYLKDLNQLLRAFDKYKRFLEKFYGEDIEKFDLLNNNLHVWRDSIAILCINTALISDEEHYKPQIIDIYGLEKLDNSKTPCIAIMHHDYYAISDNQKPFIKAKFKEMGVSATLSGHRHRYTTNIIDLGNGENIPNFCCAKSVSEPRDLWSDVGLIEYRWKIGEKEVKVIPYEWVLDKLSFTPSTRFESQENTRVDDNGAILLKRGFIIRTVKNKIGQKTLNDENIKDKTMQKSKAFEEFFVTVQKQYLDEILEKIEDDEEKFKNAISIMEQFIWYDGKKVEFEEILSLIGSCRDKFVLSISGLQGTGKSTFLSLLYYKMRQNVEKTNLFPILIDLHCLEKYSKKIANKILNEHLMKVDNLIKKYSYMKFFLMVDGADEYYRRTSALEDILYNYVNSYNKIGNFAFCIGSAEKLPDEMKKSGKLQIISRKATYKIEAHRIKKSDDEKISYIIRRLCAVYGFKVDETAIQVIKKAINVYTINKIDYRTLLIVLRIFDTIPINNRDFQLGNYFHEYYLMEMDGDEKELIKHARAAYEYTVLKKKDILRNLKHAKIIYNNGITRDFLLAYYFMYLIRNDLPEKDGVLNSNFVFTASANKFIKDLLLNKYNKEQSFIVRKLIEAYQKSDMSMKSQIGYILGRIKDSNAKSNARSFLNERWNELYEKLFKNNILNSQNQGIKSELVLFRTISVSLIWLDYYKNQENFLKCLVLNEKLNQINRAFHLEYYEDKAYINGESPTYVDDDRISVDKTMQHLINNINKGFSKNGQFNKSIYLDIITLFSIYQYRMGNQEIKEKYEKVLLVIAEKILKSSKIQSKTVINYVTTIKELLSENPYKMLVNEIYQVKDVKREGWIRRKIYMPESIADHMYGCYMLGIFFLPNTIEHCIDYEIVDKDNYKLYSKDKILQMLLLHDLAEVKIGDIVTQEKEQKDSEKESKRFDYYEFLCSFPKIYGLGNRKVLWDEFVEKSTINAKIANDIDKIEPVIQAYHYRNKEEMIDIDEWIDYARQKIHTSLGKQLLDLVIDKIIF